VLQRPSSSTVIATVALLFAVGGTAFAGAQTLLTGADVQDGSLTGQDIRDGSLRAADFSRADLPLLKPASRVRVTKRVIARGHRGPKGAPGAPGGLGAAGHTGAPAALPSVSATGPDAAGYVDGTTLVSLALPAAGTWLLLARFDATNTGASSDNLNCAFQVGAVQAGASGAQVDPGATSKATPVTVGTIDDPQLVSLQCGGNGVTTFDIANISMTAVRLA
jgi:hypothetical protein